MSDPSDGALRLLLVFEAASFAIASSVHFGILVDGYQHRTAGTAEGIIAVVLLAGLAASLFGFVPTRAAAITVQALALAGTLVGVFTIAIGVGPRTVPDVVYHLGIVGVLVVGLVVATRTRHGPDARIERPR